MIKLDSEQRVDLTLLEAEDIIDRGLLDSFLKNFSDCTGCSAIAVRKNGDRFAMGNIDTGSNVDNSSVISRAIDAASGSLKTCSVGVSDGSDVLVVPILAKRELLGAVLCEASQNLSVNFRAAVTLVELFVNSQATTGYSKIEVESHSTKLAENFIQISSTLEDLANSAQNITEQQQSLGKDISQIESVTSEIADITNSINKLADKTMMLGLNASIEAARLGNDGRGFAVVATQIRELSDFSRKTSEDIMKLNDQINGYVVSTIANSKESLKTTEDQSAAMEELSATIQTMVTTAQELKNMY